MSSIVNVVLREKKKTFNLLLEFLLILGGSLFIALLSQISLDLRFTPVPITLQTLAVLLVGTTLGSKRGALAVITYIAEGMIGLPVLAGGCYGCACIFGPTGGYLVGFIAAAWIVGYILEKKEKPKFVQAFFAALLGSAVILLIGALFLSIFVGGFKNAVSFGVIPFAAGDLFKALIFAALLPGWKFVRR